MHSPRPKHYEADLRILRYLKGTLGKGLLFANNGYLKVEVYTYADWIGSRGVNDTLILASYSGSAREKLEFGSVIIEPSSSIERAEFEYINTRLEQAREPNKLFILIYFIIILIIYKGKISIRARVRARIARNRT